MPFASSGDASLYYRVDASSAGASERPWLLLCNPLGATHEVWDLQMPVLGERFRVLRYDRRGHGQSSVPAGPYSIEMLGRDALAVMNAAGATRAHFCGMSLGGLVGQWLALNAAQRLQRVVLCSTAARIGSADGWRERIERVQREGVAPLVDATMARWFTAEFAAREPACVARVRAQLAAVPAMGYAGCCAVLIDTDFHSELPRIAPPVLTVAGVSDPTTPPAALRIIADGVTQARSVELPGAHLCNIESAAAFNRALLDFLA